MTTETIRATFEATCVQHAKDGGYEGCERLDRVGDGYADTHTQAAWWGWCEALQSPEIQALRKDAGLYRVLRDEEYQMLEDDPCVADDSFNAYFGEDLDEAVAALKSRRDAAMKEQP